MLQIANIVYILISGRVVWIWWTAGALIKIGVIVEVWDIGGKGGESIFQLIQSLTWLWAVILPRSIFVILFFRTEFLINWNLIHPLWGLS